MLSSPPRWIQLGTIALSLVIGISMWFYAFVLASPQAPADRLKDRSWPSAAEARCKAALGDLSAAGLRDVRADTPQQRGELTARADVILRRMVLDLGAIPPPADAEDARIVARWLGDWDAYLQDREQWVAQLRTGNGAPMQEQAREGGEPGGKAMQDFADINSMKSCGIPNGY